MFLQDKCTLTSLHPELKDALSNFDCGHQDLNDFFTNDCFAYSLQLIGKTYCFTLDENPETIVCAFTIANDSIRVHSLPNSRKKKIINRFPREKIVEVIQLYELVD